MASGISDIQNKQMAAMANGNENGTAISSVHERLKWWSNGNNGVMP